MTDHQERLIAEAVETLVAYGWEWDGRGLTPRNRFPWDGTVPVMHQKPAIVVSDT